MNFHILTQYPLRYSWWSHAVVSAFKQKAPVPEDAILFVESHPSLMDRPELLKRPKFLYLDDIPYPDTPWVSEALTKETVVLTNFDFAASRELPDLPKWMADLPDKVRAVETLYFPTFPVASDPGIFIEPATLFAGRAYFDFPKGFPQSRLRYDAIRALQEADLPIRVYGTYWEILRNIKPDGSYGPYDPADAVRVMQRHHVLLHVNQYDIVAYKPLGFWEKISSGRPIIVLGNQPIRQVGITQVSTLPDLVEQCRIMLGSTQRNVTTGESGSDRVRDLELLALQYFSA